MVPQQHLRWFDENIAWFEDIGVDELDRAVPNCPGWTIETVLNHLAFGLGIGYRIAVSTAPETADDQVFDGVEALSARPTAFGVLETFSTNMRGCLDVFRATDPEQPTWTYAGPGAARFWFRRAAIESALHRIDVEEVLAERRQPIPRERVADGIAETVEFALPLAAEAAGEPDGGMEVAVPGLDIRMEVGRRPAVAKISGEGADVFSALWGRNRDRVNVSGNGDIAADWLGCIELAFSGR